MQERRGLKNLDIVLTVLIERVNTFVYIIIFENNVDISGSYQVWMKWNDAQ